MSTSTCNITPSLADDSRHNLEAWTENVETHARNMCASHDPMGALSLVVSLATWNLIPANLTNPIDVHSLTHRSAPSPDTGLIVAVPRAEDAPRIAARLLTTTIPFAVLLPSDLAPRIADADQFDGQPNLLETYKSAGKIMFLDSDQLWIVGNIPDLYHFHRIHSQVLLRPAHTSTRSFLHHASPEPTLHNR